MRVFYCDGACSSNGYSNASGGYGVVEIKDNQVIYKYQDFKSPTTNNEMELMAILHILQKLDKEKDNNFYETSIIYSDSAYCVNIFNNWMYGWERNNWTRPKNQTIKNLDIIKQIYNLSYLAKVEKVKGHNGNIWNEMCDQLATGKIKLSNSTIF